MALHCVQSFTENWPIFKKYLNNLIPYGKFWLLAILLTYALGCTLYSEILFNFNYSNISLCTVKSNFNRVSWEVPVKR